MIVNGVKSVETITHTKKNNFKIAEGFKIDTSVKRVKIVKNVQIVKWELFFKIVESVKSGTSWILQRLHLAHLLFTIFGILL